VGDGAAEGTSDGESGVESSAAELLGGLSLDGSNCGRGHCECGWGLGCEVRRESIEWRCRSSVVLKRLTD
jgi:hypothetical protein